MKMRPSFLSFTLLLLSVSILFFGINGSAFADTHNIPQFSVSTDLPSYGIGDTVILSGSIRDFDPKSHAGQHALTYIIKSPPPASAFNVGQLIPNSDGTFQDTFITKGSLWKASGDYIIEVHFGSFKSEIILTYTGGESPPPVVPTCTADQELVNGECVDVAPPPPVVPTCTADQELVNGECVDKPPPPPPVVPTCSSNEEMVNGVCVAKAPVIVPPTCGEGTTLVNGICTVIPKTGGDERPGCLIATAAYGTELAPQVQFLREIRDNTVLTTQSGMAFMTGFNTLYYSFAPTVSDWERENPMFQDAVRIFITPMISSLSIMSLAEGGSEIEVLGFGISVIALNLGMYVVAPALIGFQIHKQIKSRK